MADDGAGYCKTCKGTGEVEVACGETMRYPKRQWKEHVYCNEYNANRMESYVEYVLGRLRWTCDPAEFEVMRDECKRLPQHLFPNTFR